MPIFQVISRVLRTNHKTVFLPPRGDFAARHPNISATNLAPTGAYIQ